MNPELYEKVKDRLNNMKPFTDDYIPSIPIMNNKEDYQEYVVKNYIRCGAIPKENLLIGKTYKGSCRNASKATWNGKEFEYQRYKFGYVFTDTVNHFEDDDGYDLFVPVELLNE